MLGFNFRIAGKQDKINPLFFQNKQNLKALKRKKNTPLVRVCNMDEMNIVVFSIISIDIYQNIEKMWFTVMIFSKRYVCMYPKFLGFHTVTDFVYI